MFRNSLSKLARPTLARAQLPRNVRGLKNINFGGTVETVHERADWPREKLLDYFKNDTLCVCGYGS